MPSAEQHLKDAWSHIAPEPHNEHELAQVLGISNHVVDEQTKKKRPHDAVYQAKCSCGEHLRIDLGAVMEHTHKQPAPAAAPELTPAPAPKVPAPSIVDGGTTK